MTTLNEKATTLIQRLKTANEWRRGAEIEMPNPKQLGEDIDDAIKLIESFRWRYVNVELPEPKKKGISDNVLLKYSVNGLIHDNTYECCVQAFYCHDTEMWHSLMPLDDENLKLTPIAWRPIETI